MIGTCITTRDPKPFMRLWFLSNRANPALRDRAEGRTRACPFSRSSPQCPWAMWRWQTTKCVCHKGNKAYYRVPRWHAKLDFEEKLSLEKLLRAEKVPKIVLVGSLSYYHVKRLKCPVPQTWTWLRAAVMHFRETKCHDCGILPSPTIKWCSIPSTTMNSAVRVRKINDPWVLHTFCYSGSGVWILYGTYRDGLKSGP